MVNRANTVLIGSDWSILSSVKRRSSALTVLCLSAHHVSRSGERLPRGQRQDPPSPRVAKLLAAGLIVPPVAGEDDDAGDDQAEVHGRKDDVCDRVDAEQIHGVVHGVDADARRAGHLPCERGAVAGGRDLQRPTRHLHPGPDSVA